jgi:putative peptide zinc metalloprotease protein
MASILPRLVVIIALVSGGGWAAAGSPAPGQLWSSEPVSAPVASAVEATPAPSAAGSLIDEIPFIEDGRHVNSVEALNRRNAAFEFQGRADYVREKQDDVTAGNQAVARATCTDCQTVALALQLVVYRQGATHVAPRNFAIALNEQCTRCLTMARAVQYVIPVPDPKDVPSDVKALVHELNKEMNEIERVRALNEGNVQQVDSRINGVIARFESLRAFLSDDRREAVQAEPASTQTPAATATPLATATVAPVSTQTPTAPPTAVAAPSSPATNIPVPATPVPVPSATSVPPTATNTPAPVSTATGPP